MDVKIVLRKIEASHRKTERIGDFTQLAEVLNLLGGHGVFLDSD